MKWMMKTLPLGALLAIGSAAQAATAYVALDSNTQTSVFGYRLDLSPSNGTLTFSNELAAVLNAIDAKVVGIGPTDLKTSLTARGSYKSISATLPVASVGGLFDSTTRAFTAENVNTLGGTKITTVDDGFTNSGGWLQMTHVSVDLANKSISADLSGDHGVASTNMVVWNYSSITGATIVAPVGLMWFDGPIGNADVSFSNTLSGLTITQPAFNYFSQALGLTENGINAMKSITSYGTMTTGPVPGPATYMMMSAGLLGMLGLLRMRKS